MLHEFGRVEQIELDGSLDEYKGSEHEADQTWKITSEIASGYRVNE